MMMISLTGGCEPGCKGGSICLRDGGKPSCVCCLGFDYIDQKCTGSLNIIKFTIVIGLRFFIRFTSVCFLQQIANQPALGNPNVRLPVEKQNVFVALDSTILRGSVYQEKCQMFLT